VGASEYRVNCVAPGLIETEGWKVYSPEARAAYPRSNPMMRAGWHGNIAEACGYLAGPSGGFVTGETLTVDGGGQLWANVDDWETALFLGGVVALTRPLTAAVRSANSLFLPLSKPRNNWPTIALASSQAASPALLMPLADPVEASEYRERSDLRIA